LRPEGRAGFISVQLWLKSFRFGSRPISINLLSPSIRGHPRHPRLPPFAVVVCIVRLRRKRGDGMAGHRNLALFAAC
jgi:hypothetical protein